MAHRFSSPPPRKRREATPRIEAFGQSLYEENRQVSFMLTAGVDEKGDVVLTTYVSCFWLIKYLLTLSFRYSSGLARIGGSNTGEVDGIDFLASDPFAVEKIRERFASWADKAFCKSDR